MTKFRKFLAFLLIVSTVLPVFAGCGTSVTDAFDDGADRFADGKVEEDYFLLNSQILIDELIAKYSGSYRRPVGTSLGGTSTPDPTGPSDPSAPTDVPDATTPGETQPDGGTGIPTVASLADFQQVLQDAYTSTSEHFEFEVVNGYSFDANTAVHAAHAQIEREYPIDSFCVVSGWSWSWSGDHYSFTIDYSFDRDRLIEIKNETYLLVDEAVKKIDTAGKTDYEIICAVNEYLCDTAYYPAEPYPEESYTAYGALKNGVAVCAGYTAAAKLMLNKLGIRCDIQVGDCIGGGAHAWNLVELDGTWYQMDVCWNDGGNRKAYLLVDDAYMRKSRNWDASLYPPCSVMYVH